MHFKFAETKFFWKTRYKSNLWLFLGIFWPFLTLLLPDIIIQTQNLNFLAIFTLINTLFKNHFWKWIKNALPTSVHWLGIPKTLIIRLILHSSLLRTFSFSAISQEIKSFFYNQFHSRPCGITTLCAEWYLRISPSQETY